MQHIMKKITEPIFKDILQKCFGTVMNKDEPFLSASSGEIDDDCF